MSSLNQLTSQASSHITQHVMDELARRIMLQPNRFI